MSDSEYRKELRRRHKKAGLCYMCDKPAQDGKTMCTYHLKKQSIKALRRRARRLGRHMCVMCGVAPIMVGKTKCSACIEKDRERYKKAGEEIRERTRINTNSRYNALKVAAYAAYNNKCQCCGITEESFFTFNNINSDSKEHKDELGIKGGLSFLNWLKDNNYPNTIQLLCANCHLSKTRLGICIHKIPRTI